VSAIVESQPDSQPQTEATAMIRVIERAAANPDIDVEKMERLLAMQERIMDRNAKAEFNEALAAMQPELPVITRNGEILNKAGEVQSTYAKWEDINEAIRPILAKYGFALSFRTSSKETGVLIRGILSKGGHAEDTDMFLPADTSGNKNNVQAHGSSTSYAKRYIAIALLNITTRGEDDDGQSANSEEELKEINRFVSLFTDVFDADVEEDERAAMIFKVHEQLHGKQEIYVAAAKLLGTKRKNAIRTYIEQYRQAQKSMQASWKEKMR
jgi:hypothetical protein